jgi:copper transport protein
LVVLAAAPGAFAHAVLLTTDPANGAVLKRSPAQIVLRFSESVETELGSVRVYDERGDRVDSGQLSRPSASSVAVGVDRGLPRGTYTVAWRVISADTHPVHGAFVFSVGTAAVNADAIAAGVLAGERTPRLLDIGFNVVRFLSFALLLAVVGGTVALAVVLRRVDERLRARLSRLLALLAFVLVPVSLAGLVFEGAVASGFGLLDAARWSVISAIGRTRFGEAWLARAALAALLGLAVALVRRPAVAGPLWLLLAAGLAVTTTAAGHASIGGAFVFVVDLLHVLAASVWSGGLLFTGLALRHAGREERWPLAARVVPRLSLIALGSVGVLLVAGVVNGYLEVRAWRGLWETTYGRLLLAKVALVLPLLALGLDNNRRAVPRLRAQVASALERTRFLRALTAELLLVVAVVAVTAVLVSEVPAKAIVASGGPFAATTALGPFELNVIVDPARAGSNAIHLYVLSRSGQPAQVAGAKVSATLPAQGIGPLRLPAQPAGPGHYIVSGAPLAIPGQWRLGFTVRRGEFDEWIKTINVPIRKD